MIRYSGVVMIEVFLRAVFWGSAEVSLLCAKQVSQML
jgi:hypothetical protein